MVYLCTVHVFVPFIITDLATLTHRDDEYAWAGVEDPKIVVTTSHNPSSRLKQFAKVRQYATYVYTCVHFMCAIHVCCPQTDCT